MDFQRNTKLAALKMQCCLCVLVQLLTKYMYLRNLRLQYTFGSAIFFKFGFLGQNSGRRIISNF